MWWSFAKCVNLQEDLIDVMPAVEEANSISEELDKRVKFEIILIRLVDVPNRGWQTSPKKRVAYFTQKSGWQISQIWGGNFPRKNGCGNVQWLHFYITFGKWGN